MRRIPALFLLAILLAACGGPKAGATKTRTADGMLMVYVPAGEFLRGSSEAQFDEAVAACVADGGGEDFCRDAFAVETPQRSIYLDGFWIDRTEVTNAQYRAFATATGHQAPTTCDWGESTYGDAPKSDHPVVCVDWDDAKAYCEWAGARLPTEAEWEKAARGTDGRIYPWGSTFDASRANYCDADCEFDWKDRSAHDGYARTAPVVTYPAGASPYGAQDMAGNVYEWVGDWYDEAYYATSPDRNPGGPGLGEYRVLRSGSWGGEPCYVRSAVRFRYNPDNRDFDVGFRCGLSSTSSP